MDVLDGKSNVQEYRKYIRRNKWKNMKKYFSKRNIVAIIATVTFL